MIMGSMLRMSLFHTKCLQKRFCSDKVTRIVPTADPVRIANSPRVIVAGTSTSAQRESSPIKNAGIRAKFGTRLKMIKGSMLRMSLFDTKFLQKRFLAAREDGHKVHPIIGLLVSHQSADPWLQMLMESSLIKNAGIQAKTDTRLRNVMTDDALRDMKRKLDNMTDDDIRDMKRRIDDILTQNQKLQEKVNELRPLVAANEQATPDEISKETLRQKAIRILVWVYEKFRSNPWMIVNVVINIYNSGIIPEVYHELVTRFMPPEQVPAVESWSKYAYYLWSLVPIVLTLLLL